MADKPVGAAGGPTAARVTVTVYVSIAVPSWAVTFILMTVSPTDSATCWSAAVSASASVMPLPSSQAIVALGLSVVGVTVTSSTALGTHAV